MCMRPLLMGVVVGFGIAVVVSCSKPRELGGQYTGLANESATFEHATKADVFKRAPMNETVTVMRGAGTALTIRYGTCELPAKANPDGSATIDTGATCTVNGVVGVPVTGTFHGNTASAGGLFVLFAGGGPTADGKTTYSYTFTGTRLPR